MVEFSAPTVGDLPLFFTLLALELVLSFDNAAILAALSNRLPFHQRRKALLYGLVGAYIFRVTAIFVFVIGFFEFAVVRILGAMYLIFLMVKHLIEYNQHGGDGKVMRKAPKIPGLTAFWSTVVFIEMADVAFALDQVLVAVALAGADRVLVIVAASLIAIIFLRISAFYIGRVMLWFPPLETLAYIAVGFVGTKMLLKEHFAFAPWLHYEIPNAVSIGVTFGLIILPPIGKYVIQRAQGKKPFAEIKAAELASAQAHDPESTGDADQNSIEGRTARE